MSHEPTKTNRKYNTIKIRTAFTRASFPFAFKGQ